MANLGELEGPSRAPGSSVSGVSSHGLMKDLLLSDSSSDLPDVLTNKKEDTPISRHASDSTISNIYPPDRVVPSNTGDGGDSQSGQPRTLHQAITDIGTDLEDLVSLNASVQPPDQVAFLEEVHKQFRNFLAPYLLYHKLN